MKFVCKQLATCGFCGYLPASGTVGSLVALPFIYWLSFLPCAWQVTSIIVLVIISLVIIGNAITSFKKPDPSQIVLDEFVGMTITLIGFSYSYQVYLTGFMLFRFFDILKPLGIKKIETLPGAWGIVLDDCAAGLLARLLLRLLLV